MVQRSIKIFAEFCLCVLLLQCVMVCFVPSPTAGQTGPINAENATIWGYVYDVKAQVFLYNITIKVEREFFLGNETTTNRDGMYQMALPSGTFVLRIYDEQQLVIYRMTFNISDGEVKRLDFSLDPDNTAQSHVVGTIRNKYTLSPMANTQVTLNRILLVNGTNVTTLYRETETGDNGKFNLSIPAGHYLFEVWSENKLVYSNDLVLDFGQEKEYNLVLECGIIIPEGLAQHCRDNHRSINWLDVFPSDR
jgi:hypothetical protein